MRMTGGREGTVFVFFVSSLFLCSFGWVLGPGVGSRISDVDPQVDKVIGSQYRNAIASERFEVVTKVTKCYPRVLSYCMGANDESSPFPGHFLQRDVARHRYLRARREAVFSRA